MDDNISGGRLRIGANGQRHIVETFDERKDMQIREDWEHLKSLLLASSQPLKGRAVFMLAVMNRLDAIYDAVKANKA